MFAEGKKIFLTVTVNNPDQAQLLQNDRNALWNWSDLWQLKFNAKKYAVMHLGSRIKDSSCYMHREGVQVKLQLKELEKDFALYVDPNLIFNTHYEKEVNIVNINKLLGLIKRSHIHPHNET